MHSTDRIRQARAFLSAAVGPNPSPRTVTLIDQLGPVDAAEAILAGTVSDLPSESVTDTGGADLLAAAARRGVGFLIPEDPQWPAALNDLNTTAGRHPGLTPVYGLWYQGDLAVLDSARTKVALTGSRDSSGYGDSVASDLAGTLARKRAVTVTGNSQGIERRAALVAAAAGGQVILVQPAGAAEASPSANEDVMAQVLQEGGLVVSEAPDGARSSRNRFLARQRIIAALSAAVVIVEARWRTETLNPARIAGHLGRPAGAVPGSIYSSQSAGTHALLADGEASIVTDGRDMLKLAGITV